jgi:hypothetical protein
MDQERIIVKKVTREEALVEKVMKTCKIDSNFRAFLKEFLGSLSLALGYSILRKAALNRV